jgi:lysophospholipid acyltransferase (LPLAT)-like uncharacterized protein
MAEMTLTRKLRIFVLPVLIEWVGRLWFSTVRTEIHHKETYERYILGGKNERNIVLGIWHRNMIFSSYFLRKAINKLTLVSASKDGDIAAGVAPRFGYEPIRGSSSRGGTRALKALISEMRKPEKNYLCFTAIDGSREPARIIEPGMLLLAQKTDALILPMTISGTKLITFRRIWDQMIIPMPFSKIIVDFAQPIEVPSAISKDEREGLRQEVEVALNELTDKVDSMCGYI